jgi:hypothetical protein
MEGHDLPCKFSTEDIIASGGGSCDPRIAGHGGDILGSAGELSSVVAAMIPGEREGRRGGSSPGLRG